ncbi:cytochrome P450 [Coprinopsis marcescibilis]|uniref:Cytochrome P450 n=1 Tax=Coprinopsis marcescibilis TaxID=230819 RepID=A0A5C3LKP3_COPMA|nr:cytochrome P450 [Coprinopsis marcescibilis]
MVLSLSEAGNTNQAATVLAATWVGWLLYRKLTTKDPLSNIPGPKSNSFVTGHFLDLFNVDGWGWHDKLAEEYPGIARIASAFGGTMVHVHDPKALYHLMIKDQTTFEESDDILRINRLIFGPGLMSISGDHHRKQRKLINPVFASDHLRDMVPIFHNVTQKLRNSIRAEISRGKTEIEMFSWLNRTALELIGQSGLGTSFDRLEPESPPHPFYKAAKSVMETMAKFTFSRFVILPYVENLGSARFRRFVVDMLPWKDLHEIRDISDTMHATVLNIYETKKHLLEKGDQVFTEQVSQGRDAISILMKANMMAPEDEKMSKEELLGQMSTLMFGAMDTTSNALSRVLHLLSENQDVQDRLREEIRSAKKVHDQLMYEELHQLPYLDAVCKETLRLFPPLPFTSREAKQDGVLPLAQSFTGLDGKEYNEVVIPRDTMLIVSIRACNQDPLIWGPDAREWKPERWLSPLPESVANARIPGVYSHLMTFIGGGRACIGFKFAQLEMKVVLSTLLESFRFSPAEKRVSWQMTIITRPVVADDSEGELNGPRNAQLPLKVSLVA